MFSQDEFMRMIWNYPETPYQRRCRQLREFIQSKLNFKRLSVSRCYIGNRTFYNIDINSKTTNSWDLDKLFKGVPSGVVYYNNNGVKHFVYCVDEEELHEKYLNADGDLVFEEPFCLFDLDFKQKYDILCPIRRQLEDNRIQVNKIDIWDDYLMLVCNGTDYVEVGEILNIDNNMVNVVAGVPNLYMIKRWDK